MEKTIWNVKIVFIFFVCSNVYGEVNAETEINNINDKGCYCFDDKSKYIKSPCSVGNKIYRICSNKDENYLRTETVLFIETKQGKSGIVTIFKTEYTGYIDEDWDSLIFSNPNVAKQKLAELIN